MGVARKTKPRLKRKPNQQPKRKKTTKARTMPIRRIVQETVIYHPHPHPFMMPFTTWPLFGGGYNAPPAQLPKPKLVKQQSTQTVKVQSAGRAGIAPRSAVVLTGMGTGSSMLI